MSMIDIANNDAFSVTSLTASINEEQDVPGQINNSGLFSEEGVTSTTVQIEKNGDTLSLVPSQDRGGPGIVVNGSKRTLIPFNTIHLPQQASIMADEVQNVRAFGSEGESQQLLNVVNARARKMRRNNDATIEHLKVGAIKGLILDADGATTLLDVYAAFGMTQTSFGMAIPTAATKMIQKVRDLMNVAEDQMDGIAFTGAKAYCGRNFYNELASHSKVEAAYNRYNESSFLRDGLKNGFEFGGVFWEQYRGAIGANRFIADDEAYLVLEGVQDMFITRYAPANYNETVNTLGLPHYASIEAMNHGKGFELETQSNPLCICARPQAVIKLTKI